MLVQAACWYKMDGCKGVTAPSLRGGGQGLRDDAGGFEAAARHTDGGLVAVGADNEAGAVEVDGPEPFLHGWPIDDHFDVGAHR